MCRRVTCRECGKATWAGCGAHVDSVMRGVPKDDQCRCREERADKAAAPGEPAAKEARGLFRTIFGRS